MKQTYVFKYTTKNGIFIGYHIDSFCSISKDIADAKRYETDNPDTQKEVIQKNFDYLVRNHGSGKFYGNCAKNVVLSYEVLSDDIVSNPQTLVLIPIN